GAAPVASRRNSRRLRETDSMTSRGFESKGRLPIELQSELDLPGIVGRVARRRDSAEVGVLEIERAGSADHGRSTRGPLGCGEVRMIGEVEELGPELEPGFLRGPKFLER